MNDDRLKQLGIAVIDTEAEALLALKPRIDESFVHACSLILNSHGRVIVTGIGKSGHIANKIAATLASTGTPAFFVHPGEASHGDLGMIQPGDVVIALSNSGEASEILTLIPLLKRMGISLITLTGNSQSNLALAANANLNVSVEKEACPLGLAPTASTTATLAMGDALAVALLESRGFTAEDFALSHPGGRLGRRLLLHVEDVMLSGHDIPRVTPEALLPEALLEMSAKGLGITAIASEEGTVHGVFTDGDLRRFIDQDLDLKHTPMKTAMTAGGFTIQPQLLAAEAVDIMHKHKVSALLVLDKHDKLCGVITLHTLLKAGVM